MSSILAPARFVVSFYKDHVGMVESGNKEDAEIIFGQVTIRWAKVLMEVPARKILVSSGSDAVELCKTAIRSAPSAGARYAIAFVKDSQVRKLSASNHADAEAMYNQIPNECAKLLVEVPAPLLLRTHGFNPWVSQCEEAVRAAA